MHNHRTTPNEIHSTDSSNAGQGRKDKRDRKDERDRKVERGRKDKRDINGKFAGMKNIDRNRRYIASMVMAIVLCTAVFSQKAFTSHAMIETLPEQSEIYGEVYQNPETGYSVIVEDDAELLMDDERTELVGKMQEITAYGNVAFKSIPENSSSTEAFADYYYYANFGTDSGTLFLIDMENRNIWIFSDGAVYEVVTTAYAETVTDNVYRLASDEAYYECAAKAFEQITALLKGQKIAQPMKYISNALLALSIGLLLNFGVAIYLTKAWRAENEELLSTVNRKFFYTRPTIEYLSQTKKFSPRSHGGGGSGGGGGSSGGGGGHGF